MNYRRITAISLALAVLVFAACDKEGRKRYPSTLPDQKITNIYETTSFKTETLNPVTKEWTVLVKKDNPRHLAHEFTWEGDRLESMKDHNYDRFYSFNYDEYGRVSRIICDSDSDFSRTLSYDAEGLLARCEGAIKDHDGVLVSTQTLIYTWEDGLLKRIEEETWSHFPGEEEISKKITRTYTWQDGNVVSTTRTKHEGDKTEELQYNYEYSTAVNPLHGFVYLVIPDRGIIFDYEGIDCLSKNLPSRITSSPTSARYEFSYTPGTPLASFEKHMIGDSSPVLRLITDYSVELEYAR